MPKQAVKPKIEEKQAIQKRSETVRGSYIMARTVRSNGILYKKGEQVEFTDKHTQTLFLKNNYIV